MSAIINYDEEVAPRQHELFVKSYNETFNCHECLFDGKRRILIDLFVSGDFPDDVEPEDLVGKTVSVSYAHGYIWLAHNVQVVTPRC